MGKGISPLIAAIALVIVIAGIASTFFTELTKEQTETRDYYRYEHPYIGDLVEFNCFSLKLTYELCKENVLDWDEMIVCNTMYIPFLVDRCETENNCE